MDCAENRGARFVTSVETQEFASLRSPQNIVLIKRERQVYFLNAAVTFVAALMVIVHVDIVPLHPPPLQPVKVAGL